MEYITKTLEFKVEEASAITFGKFDGLHKGHERLIESMLEACRRDGLKAIAFSFDLPPKAKVDGEQVMVLTTNEEKRLIFESTGVDYLIECPFTPAVMTMEPETFIAWIVERLSVKLIVVGSDFRFGHNRSGDHYTLMAFEKKYGYRTIVIDKVKDKDRDISSSYIREMLLEGDIEHVNELLGYDYFLTSKVIHGRQLGRTIGIPTINMQFDCSKLLPQKGVYVTRVLVDDQWYAGVTNVGNKPTVGEHNPIGVETYIIDFCQDLYGRVITVEFLRMLRPERKFENLDALKMQMSEDIAAAMQYFSL